VSNINKLDKIADELADQYLSGNKTDVLDGIEVWKPMEAAYLVIQISQRLPSCYRDSFGRALARRCT